MSNYTTGKHRTPEDSAQYTTENENELSVHISVANLSQRTSSLSLHLSRKPVATYVVSTSTSQSQTCRHVRSRTSSLSLHLSRKPVTTYVVSASTSQSRICRHVRRLSVQLSLISISSRSQLFDIRSWRTVTHTHMSLNVAACKQQQLSVTFNMKVELEFFYLKNWPLVSWYFGATKDHQETSFQNKETVINTPSR